MRSCPPSKMVLNPHPRRGVAQSGSVPALGAGGREFESRLPDHFPFYRFSDAQRDFQVTIKGVKDELIAGVRETRLTAIIILSRRSRRGSR